MVRVGVEEEVVEGGAGVADDQDCTAHACYICNIHICC